MFTWLRMMFLLRLIFSIGTRWQQLSNPKPAAQSRIDALETERLTVAYFARKLTLPPPEITPALVSGGREPNWGRSLNTHDGNITWTSLPISSESLQVTASPETSPSKTDSSCELCGSSIGTQHGPTCLA